MVGHEGVGLKNAAFLYQNAWTELTCQALALRAIKIGNKHVPTNKRALIDVETLRHHCGSVYCTLKKILLHTAHDARAARKRMFYQAWHARVSNPPDERMSSLCVIMSPSNVIIAHIHCRVECPIMIPELF